jgi:hypothetical protein
MSFSPFVCPSQLQRRRLVVLGATAYGHTPAVKSATAPVPRSLEGSMKRLLRRLSRVAAAYQQQRRPGTAAHACRRATSRSASARRARFASPAPSPTSTSSPPPPPPHRGRGANTRRIDLGLAGFSWIPGTGNSA